MHERLGLHESVLSQLVEIEMELEQIGTGGRGRAHSKWIGTARQKVPWQSLC